MNWLQLLERVTPECLAAAQALRACTTKHLRAFQEQVRLVCLDGASSNPRYESEVIRRLGHTWHLFLLGCEDHLIALILKGIAAQMKRDIEGQTHWAKSLNHNMGLIATAEGFFETLLTIGWYYEKASPQRWPG